MSDAKSFDLGYYKKEKLPEIVFDTVGRVDVFCAIHTRMHCIILVLPNGHFAKADRSGRFLHCRRVHPWTDLPALHHLGRAGPQQCEQLCGSRCFGSSQAAKCSAGMKGRPPAK